MIVLAVIQLDVSQLLRFIQGRMRVGTLRASGRTKQVAARDCLQVTVTTTGCVAAKGLKTSLKRINLF